MKARILKSLAALLALVAVLGALVVVRALTVDSAQVDVEPTTLEAPQGAEQRLARAVQFETISHADPSRMEMEKFAAFNDFLVEAFPRAHEAMERELVAPCSVLYTWPGSDEAAKPVLFAAHTDVVPVEPHEAEQWTHPPFSGAIADGWIWGRGTLDDKVSVLGLLEAVELLASRGHAPKRTLVFAFGCDEEVGGQQGAKKMAALLAERGHAFELAVDEGLAIVDGYVPGIARPVGLIGIVEKGFATYTLTVQTEGGHSSMPPRESAIGILSNAIARLEAKRMPPSLNPASRLMFETLAAEMSFGLRLVMANLWLLEPVLVRQLTTKPSTNATVRTTTAVTTMHAGVQDNVLAKKAEAKVNFRLAPGHTLEDVERHLVDAIDDARVKVALDETSGFKNPASRISDHETAGFRAIRDAIRAAFGNEVVVAPGSTTGGTDVRHYQSVSKDQYRFAPLVLRARQDDTARIHGVDERIAVEDYRRAVQFYAELLSRW